VRIIRGKLKSRRIFVPKGFTSRPTTDFAKEGLFNIIDNRIDLDDMAILDLCSGTGNISLEFISGGVGSVLAVDQNFASVRYLQKVAKELELDNELTVLKSEVIQFLKRTEMKFDLIFSDPPYAENIHKEMVDLIYEREVINEKGWVIIEHGKKTDLSEIENFQFMRSYGNVLFSFFRKGGDNED
jgi:16S rRNA (guanine966-N2)-methyltransferase